MSRRRTRIFILIFASFTGCTKPSDAQLDAVLSSLELTGCMDILQGPICQADPGTKLTVWIPELAATTTRFEFDGAPATVTATSAAGGTRHLLALDRPASELRIELIRGEARAVRQLAMRAPTKHAALDEANAAKRAGDYRRAEQLLADHASSLTGELESRALGLAGRIALAKGQHATALELLARAVTAAERDGLISRVVDDSLVRSYVLTWFLRDFTTARTDLGVAERAAALGYPKGLANTPYYAGLLERETGDLRTAIQLFARAELHAERLGMSDLSWSVRQMRATTLAQLGRPSEARVLLENAAHALRNAPACERADVLANLGWVRLIHRDRRPGADPENPAPTLEQALQLYQTSCPQPARASTVHVSLALAALQDGDTKAARSHLTEARKTVSEPTLDVFLWWLDLDGRIALAEGDAKSALNTYRRLEQLGQSAVSHDAVFRAALGQGRAHARQRSIDAAIAAYKRAEAELETQSLRVPLGQGRDSFLAEHEASARELVELLIAQNAAGEALSVARLARARLLDRLSLEHRLHGLSPEKRKAWDVAIGNYRKERDAMDTEAANDWKLPLDRVELARAARKQREDQLRAALDEALALVASPSTRRSLITVAPGELLLAYFPGTKGWIGIAADASGARAESIGEVAGTSVDQLAARVLQPFAEEIARAERIRVLPHGASRAIDIHALPFRGAPLISQKPIVYGLDLGRATTSTQAAAKTAAIVADARGDLPQARSEAELVARALASRGIRAIQILGDRAGSDAVRAALADSDLLHYAGHGVFSGVEGLESALPLARGARLTAADILALERVPERIILSGCETARSSEVGAESIGLAQAFIAAGALAVIAASRPVSDDLARDLSTSLHRASTGDAGADLRAAVLPLIHEKRDWAAFRVLVP